MPASLAGDRSRKPESRSISSTSFSRPTKTALENTDIMTKNIIDTFSRPERDTILGALTKVFGIDSADHLADHAGSCR